ncbi:hypothetical protein AGR5A_Lc70256 [Agrobacterium genomosp. 5 str. CFBP 6626]|nr:hypothetical protein AGR5A_Lc70256 [Agrobacterium genomosp. 5 str. CFBP 6626]
MTRRYLSPCLLFDSAGTSATPAKGQSFSKKRLINLTGDIYIAFLIAISASPCHARVCALSVEVWRRRIAHLLHGIALFHSSAIQSPHPNQNAYTSMLLFAPVLNRFGKGTSGANQR